MRWSRTVRDEPICHEHPTPRFQDNCTYSWSGRKHAKVIYRRLSASKIPSPWSLYDSRNAMESTFSVSFYGFSHMVTQSIS